MVQVYRHILTWHSNERWSQEFVVAEAGRVHEVSLTCGAWLLFAVNATSNWVECEDLHMASRVEMSEGETLKGKLGATLREYLRQRESGQISSAHEVGMQLSQLYRAAALSATDALSTIRALTSALLAQEEYIHIVHAIHQRVEAMLQDSQKASSNALKSLVEEVRESSAELGEQCSVLLTYDERVCCTSSCEYMVEAVRATLDCRNESLYVDIIKIEPDGGKAEVLKDSLEELGAKVSIVPDREVMAVMKSMGKVIVSACGVCKTGVIAHQGGRLVAKAAKRAGAPVVAMVPAYSIVKHLDEEKIIKVRQHPGQIWAYEEAHENVGKGIEVVGAQLDLVPLSEFDLVMTEFGAYDPKYLFC